MTVLVPPKYFLMALLIFTSGYAFCQSLPYLERPVSLNGKKQAVSEIFKIISDQTGVEFSYTQNFNDKRGIAINCKGKALRLVLNEILKEESCSYKLKNKYIIIHCGEKQKNETKKLIGYVYNARDSSVLENASIYVRQTKQTAWSNSFGFFSLNYTDQKGLIEVSLAKEEFCDTAILVTKESGKELVIYLQPEKKHHKEEPEIPVLSISDTTIESNKDTLNYKKKRFNAFWEEFTKTNLNLRNISDTLFSDLSISLVPPISTNRFLSINTTNKVSINLLVGYSKGVSVFELGGLLNIDNGNVKSVQIGGLGNLVSGRVEGFQLGGLFNQVSQEMKGAQIAGLFNFNTSTVKGLQIAGLGNNSMRSFEGLQIGGLYNWNKNTKGFQLAGIVNISDTAKGFQLAGILNSSKVLKGSQLALINVCDTAEGMPIGFFSFVRKGYHKFELSLDELGFAGLSFGSGVTAFHNIFFGAYNLSYPEVWSYGYGLGSSFRLGKKWGLNIELSAQQIQSMGSVIKANILTKTLLSVEWHLHPKFQVGLGPTCSFLNADSTDPLYQNVYKHMVPYQLYETENEARTYSLWLGARVYVKFL